MRKDNKKKNLLIAILIAFIMITSVIGFISVQNSNNTGTENLKYNDYEIFKANNGQYAVYVKNDYYYFDNLPTDVDNITVNMNLNTQKIYLAYDHSVVFNDYSLKKLGRVLINLGYLVQRACTNEENCPDIPIVNCNQTEKVISFKVSNSSSIYSDDNCIVLEGSNIDHVRFVDRINYGLLGVIK